METVIATTASRQRIRDWIYSLPSAIAGTSSDDTLAGQGVRGRMAMAWFTLTRDNFRALGKGETGADNMKWQRNSPRYLAYGKGPKSTRKGSGWMPNNYPAGSPNHVASSGQRGRPERGTGELSMLELDVWWDKYLEWKGTLLMQGWNDAAAKRRAAQIAWEHIGPNKTLLHKFGNRPDRILKNRGTLELSITPGQFEGGGATVNYLPKNAEQIYRQEQGWFVVGTNSPHARKHHEGLGHMPERRLWPTRIIPEWFTQMVNGIVFGWNEGLKDIF